MDVWLQRAPLIASGALLALLTLLTCLGNLGVILAICSERVLRNAQNYLVLSLAVADLMVALLVMPLAALYQLQGQWTFGMCPLSTFNRPTFFPLLSFLVSFCLITINIIFFFCRQVFCCATCGRGPTFYVVRHRFFICWPLLSIDIGRSPV